MSTPEKKLFKFVNPSNKFPRNTKKSVAIDSSKNIKTAVFNNNRSISRLILLSKTQQTSSFSHSFRLKSPEIHGFLEKPEPITHFPIKKSENSKELSSPNSLHFDISHQLNRPYFRASVKTPPIWRFPNKLSKTLEKPVEKSEEIVYNNEEFYLKSLRKCIPLALAEYGNPPSSRLELSLLKSWLDAQKSLIEEKFKGSERISQKKLVFELVYNELRRQMSCSCLETGELLRELWEFQQNSKEIERKELEKAFLEKNAARKAEFLRKIAELEEKIQGKEREIREKSEKFEETLVEVTVKGKTLLKSQENEHELTKKLTETRKILGFLKKKVAWLSKENENLAIKLEKLPRNFEKTEKSERNREHESSSSSNFEEDDDKILEDIKENEVQTLNLKELNQIIVTSIPEVKEIKHFCEKATEISKDFASYYQENKEIQTELTLMDKLFEKNMRNTQCVEEMCQDFQYKTQLKDVNSKKYRASALLTSNLFEKLSNNELFMQNSMEKSVKRVSILNANFQKKTEEIVKENEEIANLERDLSKKSESLDASFISNYNESESIEENSEKHEEIVDKNEEIVEKREEIVEKNLEIFEKPQEIIEKPQEIVVEKHQEIFEKPKEKTLISIKAIDQDPKKMSISLKESANRSDSRSFLSPLRKASNFPLNFANYSARPSSLDLDLDRVIELFKAESLKAQDFEEKFKRNAEMLQMESAHRKKLESKNCELLKILETLQKELESARKFEETQRKRKEKQSLKEEPVDLEEISKKVTKKTMKKPGVSPRKQEISQKKLDFSLGKHVQIAYEHQKQNLGSLLLEKIKSKKMSKFHNFMHIKLILKQIHMIYFERIAQMKENSLIKEQDFASYTYSFLLSLFGLKKIADKRFIILILSVKRQLSFFRVSIFAKFLGLFDPVSLNFSVDELNKYCEALDFITNISTMGPAFTNNESDSKFLVPFLRALQYTGLFGDTRMTTEESNELKREIESFKENDPKNVHKHGLIDFDVFMERILHKYKILVNRAKTYVINAFAACDLDGNKMCNLQEFLLLNRHIEKDIYDEEKVERIFLDNADIEKDGEKNLSFDKFSVVCVEFNLFSDEAQDRYLQVKKKSQIEVKMQEVCEKWEEKRAEIQKRFEELDILSEEEIENWKEIIRVLDMRITGKTQAEVKPTLIAYTILDNESERLVEMQKNYKEDEENYEEELENYSEELEGNESENSLN